MSEANTEEFHGARAIVNTEALASALNAIEHAAGRIGSVKEVVTLDFKPRLIEISAANEVANVKLELELVQIEHVGKVIVPLQFLARIANEVKRSVNRDAFGDQVLSLLYTREPAYKQSGDPKEGFTHSHFRPNDSGRLSIACSDSRWNLVAYDPDTVPKSRVGSQTLDDAATEPWHGFSKPPKYLLHSRKMLEKMLIAYDDGHKPMLKPDTYCDRWYGDRFEAVLRNFVAAPKKS